MFIFIIHLLLFFDFSVFASPINAIIPRADQAHSKNPKVTINNNEEITGMFLANGAVESYRGIPFAKPPVKELSYHRPVAYSKSYNGLNATSFKSDCTAIDLLSAEGLGGALLRYSSYLSTEFQLALASVLLSRSQSDDCLYLNVYRPANISTDANLPVLVWIYGGAFISGGSSSYSGEIYVEESMKMDMPVIFVSLNYRLGPWGFMGGEDIQNEKNTNAGLLDQRMALEWVADHIKDFGGDPSRVVIFGESAGAMSVAHQMMMNDGDNLYKKKSLFSGAIMQSGSALPLKNVTSARPQKIFDKIINEIGCGKDENKLSCLRAKDSKDVKEVLKSVPMTDLFLAFSPHSDGDVLKMDSYDLFRKGKFAKVPYITGNQEDEGTLFASMFNATSNEDIISLFKEFFTDATKEDIESLSNLYPENPASGSPYRTAFLNVLTPQYKRISSFLGDLLFHAPRRLMIENTPKDLEIYNYLSSTGEGTPYLGTFHASDLAWQFGLDFGPSKVYKRYWISFAATGNPNNNTGLPYWDKYDRKMKNTLNIRVASLGLIGDTFREKEINDLKNNTRLRI